MQKTRIDIPELELYIGNKENHLLRYYEPEPGVFIAESRNVISLALDAGFEPISAIYTSRIASDPILERLDVPTYLVDEDEVKAHLGYILPGGICCAMRRKGNADYAEIIRSARRIVVLDDVENPTNVGAIFRSAAAFGVDAILLSPACVDPLYRRALRVSVGNAFVIPWAYMCRTEDEWVTKGLGMLKDAGFRTVALALRDDNINIDDPILKSDNKIALIMGNEGYGLVPSVIEQCDYVAKIPMQNGVDSLNVAVAAGLAMWELTK